MSERLLYEERQWFPWRFAALSTLGIAGLCLLGGLLARPTLAVAGLALLLAAGCSVLFFGYVWIVGRTSPVRLDERALRPPWRPPVPLELIETARTVEGDELKRIRAELGRGMRGLPVGTAAAAVPGLGLAGLNLAQASLVFSMRRDPVLKGLVMPYTRRAIYLETDSRAGLTRRWLIGTKHPREFMDVLGDAIAAAKSREAEQDSLPLSSILPRDEHGHAVIPEEV